VPTIDLNAPCFGFKECVTVTGDGSPPAPSGTFQPLSPTRILDTRSGLGIPNGPVRPGDGSIDTSNDDFRAEEELNHELVVTGRAGVPDHGVAAVLLTSLRLTPKVTDSSQLVRARRARVMCSTIKTPSVSGPMPPISISLRVRRFQILSSSELGQVGASAFTSTGLPPISLLTLPATSPTEMTGRAFRALRQRACSIAVSPRKARLSQMLEPMCRSLGEPEFQQTQHRSLSTSLR